MANKAWAIKLGSGGICIPFCEKREIVGLGWGDLDETVLSSNNFTTVWNEVNRAYGASYGTNRKISIAAGTVHRFWNECDVDDYVLYYNPPAKSVRVTRVIDTPKKRNFDPKDPCDIWLWRKVSYPCSPIPITDFYGGLKGSLLGPRGSFWSLDYNLVDLLAQGKQPHLAMVTDPDLNSAYLELKNLILVRLDVLDATDWEKLVGDYFRSLGASVGKIGGTQAVNDLEARFQLGIVHEEVWRVQVRRYQGKKVTWNEIADWEKFAGDANLCFVSVFGFTEDAFALAEANDIKLLEGGDFVPFVMGGRYDTRIRDKLCLPSF